MRRRIDSAAPEPLQRFSTQGVDEVEPFNTRLSENNPEGLLFLVGGKDVYVLPSHAETAAVKIEVVTLVLALNEFIKEGPSVDALPFFKGDQHAIVGLRRPKAVDAGGRWRQ